MKVRVRCVENGKVVEFEREVDCSGCVHVGYGIIPVKEIRSWIPTMYPGVRGTKVEVVE